MEAAIWADLCEPSSTTILRGGASGRFISVVHIRFKKSRSLACPQCKSMGVKILLVVFILGSKVPTWPFAFFSRSFFNARNLHTVTFGCRHEFLIGIVAVSIEESNFQKLKGFCLGRRVRTQSFLIQGVVKVPPRTTCFFGAPLSCTPLWVLQASFESHVA